MRNLATGEETYICGSYTKENLISFMEEPFEWLDADTIRIGEISDRLDRTVYDAAYNGYDWEVKERIPPDGWTWKKDRCPM
jgi:hypothetical protein